MIGTSRHPEDFEKVMNHYISKIFDEYINIVLWSGSEEKSNFENRHIIRLNLHESQVGLLQE